MKNKIRLHKLILLVMMVALTVGVSQQCLATDSQINPFDATQEHNQYDISLLTCQQFLTMITEKNRMSGDAIIWMHGVVSGLDVGVNKFSPEFVKGIMWGIGDLCEKQPNIRLFDAVLQLRKTTKAQ